MPPLKQVTALQDIAVNSLVASFLGFCLDEDIRLEDILKGISLWKKEIRAGMATKLVPDFYNRFLKDLMLTDIQVGRLRRIWIKIVTDEAIIGLDCTSLVQPELPEDADSIRGITRLQVHQLPYSLDTFHLEHLTVLEYWFCCTDSDLQVLGANCLKLKDVDVSESPAVTDVGLVALASCLPELQLLKLRRCENVTPTGLNDFLSISKSVRHLWAWHRRLGPGFEFRELPNWEANLSVNESLESFGIVEDLTKQDLLHLVTKYPNLRSIQMSVHLGVDLNVFKYFSRLSKIEFSAGNGSRWAEFESLLEFFGPQIVDLNVRCNRSSTMQQGLDSIFRFCKNLEDLVFRSNLFELSPEARLVVPPFEGLTKFECGCSNSTKLELSGMPNLKYLVFDGFNGDVIQIESTILDHRNFTNLKVIEMKGFWDSRENDLNRLRRIVTTNNLDLEIK